MIPNTMTALAFSALVSVVFSIQSFASPFELLTNDGWISRELATPGSPEETLFLAFDAAEDDSFADYLALVHPEERQTETQQRDRKRYEWARFKRQFQWYIAHQNNEEGLILVRRDTPSHQAQRLFLQDQIHEGRMPTPVRFKLFMNRWMITVNSL